MKKVIIAILTAFCLLPAASGNSVFSKYNSQVVFHGNPRYDAENEAFFFNMGDYLTIPDNADFHFGTGDFTIECWIKLESLTDDSPIIVGQGSTGPGRNLWELYVCDEGAGFVNAVNGKNLIHLFVYYDFLIAHKYNIVVTRKGNEFKFFVNEQLGDRTTSDCVMAGGSATPLHIGKSSFNNSGYFHGWIGGLNIVKSSK